MEQQQQQTRVAEQQTDVLISSQLQMERQLKQQQSQQQFTQMIIQAQQRGLATGQTVPSIKPQQLDNPASFSCTGCLKIKATEIQRAVVHHKRG
jgi:hypothetical protein